MNDQPGPPIDPAAALVDPDGRALSDRKREDARCPRCGSGPDHRCKSGGFGRPWTVCSECGYDFHDRPWQEPER